MNIIILLTSVILFVLLTPGVLLRLPNKGPIYVVAGVHSILFALLLWGLVKFVLKPNLEGFGMVTSPPQSQAVANTYKNTTHKYITRFAVLDSDNASVKTLKQDAIRFGNMVYDEIFKKTDAATANAATFSIYKFTLSDGSIVQKDSTTFFKDIETKISENASTTKVPSNLQIATMPVGGGAMNAVTTNPTLRMQTVVPTSNLTLEERIIKLEAKTASL